MQPQKPLLEQLIDALQCLPGVGRKSAQRMAYHLLERQRKSALHLSDILSQAMTDIGHCAQCRDYTESHLCYICANEKRDSSVICVVESPADIAAIESTGSYSGKYFVLMGNLSPLDGIGPEEIGLEHLKKLLIENECTEIIVATSSTVEGEATAHFIATMVANIKGVNNQSIEASAEDVNTRQINVSRLAQGVPIGGELEYLDSSTLALSLANRSKI